MKRLERGSFGLAVLLVGLVSFGPLSTDMYLPSLPSMADDLGSDPAEVQLTLSVFMFGLAFGQLIYGPLSDRFGRRPLLIGGVGLYALASLVCVAAPTIDHLIAARAAQAVGGGAGTVLARAVVRDLYERDDAARMLAYMATAMAVTPLIAPTFGGLMVEVWGWRANFWVLTAFGGLILAATSGWLPETNRFKDPRATRPRQILFNYRVLLGHRTYLGFVLVGSGGFSIIFSFISGSSFVFIDLLGLAPWQFGMCFGAVVAGFMLGSLLAGRFTHRIGLETMVGIGCGLKAVFAAVLVAFPLAGVVGVPTLLVPMFLMTVGGGLTMPNAIAGAIAPFPKMAGTASALQGFVQMAAGAGMGVLVGQLYDGSVLPMVLVIAAAGWISLAAYLGLIRRTAT